MRIEAITLREIRMPLVHFFETSSQRISSRRILLVTVQTEEVNGWGECVADADPFYSPETVDTASCVIRDFLAPMLLGKIVEKGMDVPGLLSRVRGHQMAKAALENAIWDAEAKIKTIPLWKLLDGARALIPCGVSIGIQPSHEQLLESVEAALSAGYQRIKLKVRRGWDVEVLSKVRERWPNILLSCDANCAYTPLDFEHLKRFDEFGLLMIEQPLWNDDLYFHAELQKQLRTPICLDESIECARDAQVALQLGSCRIINIKVGRVGGFSEAIAIHNISQHFNVPVWCGGMLESGLGRSHNIALSTLANFTLPGDVSASARYWAKDIIDPEVTVSSDGFITVPDLPGMGYRLCEDYVEEITIKKETLHAA
jgi:O-succinylbenzoate synthase